MIAFLRTWILNIVVVIIFITFLEILLPSSSMKKYIKLVIGLLVMMVILNPIFQLINGKYSLEDEILKTTFMIEQQSLPTNAKGLQKSQNQQVLELYKTKIKQQLEEKIEKQENVEVISVEVETNEDSESEEFGQIKRIELVISPVNEEKGIQKSTKETIKPVELVTIQLDSQNQESQTMMSQEKTNLLVDKVKSNISEFYDISKNNIYINISKTSY